MGITQGTLVLKGRWYHWKHRRDGRIHWTALRVKTLAEARRVRAALIAEYHKDGPAPYGEQRDPTIAELWDAYLSWAEANGRAKFTVNANRTNLFLVADFLKAARMSDITAQGLEDYKAHRKALGKASSSFNAALKDIRAIYARAIRQGWYTGGNPALDVDRYNLPRKAPTFHTREQLDALLQAAEGVGQDTYWLVLIMGLAGLRRGEAVNLRWEHLDFHPEHPVIKVRPYGSFRIKTGEERDIPMHRAIKDALEPHRQADGYILNGRKPVGPRALYRYDGTAPLRRALEAAGLPTACAFQRLRRTFGSLLAQQGVSLFKIARWCGHSVAVCERHYAGLQPHDSDIDRL